MPPTTAPAAAPIAVDFTVLVRLVCSAWLMAGIINAVLAKVAGNMFFMFISIPLVRDFP
ncbi:hypothetical protein [Neisseria weixii]|uniref:hypothetical protein n=1 Tax=Neisseria weixii TaxID=1853276 RepID=UPI001F222F31|nr:hypothetical protein [Neisseria weixii]